MPRVHKLRDYLIVTILRLVTVIPTNLTTLRQLIKVKRVVFDQPNQGDELRLKAVKFVKIIANNRNSVTIRYSRSLCTRGIK